MAGFNVSADDSSPLISYSPAGAWTDSPSNDSSAPSYSQRSFHTSSSNGASATIQFNGTGIWFFGAKRPTYGPYSISIDGDSVASNAHSQNALFQQLLGGRSDLTNGPHTAVLTNTGSGSPIDLDAVVFETEIGSASATITTTTIDDTSSAITYLPTPADWVLDKVQGLYNDTLHYTQTGGAQAQFTFDGDAVAIFGSVSPHHADYTVTMDGVAKSFHGGSNGPTSHVHVDTLLYFIDGLTSGSHSLTLTADPAQPGQNNTGKFMDVDRIVVLNTSNGPTTNGNSGSTAKSSSVGSLKIQNGAQGSTQLHSLHRLNIAVIGGVMAGIFVLLLLIILAVILFHRRGVQQGRLRPKFSMWQPRTPNLPMQTPPPWGMTPRTAEAPSPFLHPSGAEKVIRHPHLVPIGPQENPFTDDARVELPSVPEMSMVRGGYDGQSGTRQVKSSARPTVPIRPARPPTLDLPHHLTSGCPSG